MQRDPRAYELYEVIMDEDIWYDIKKAFEIVKSGVLKRADGDSGEGFLVYRAGTIIRIDIKVKDGK